MDNEKKDKIFVDGMKFFPPSESAPEWIIGKLWVKVDELKAWLDTHNTNNGGLNIDIKKSAKGAYYCELNTFVPGKPKAVAEARTVDIEYPQEEVNPDDVPF